MSFFDKAKAAAASAADATKKAAVAATAAAKSKYAELKAPPTCVKCSGCPLNVEVPPQLWEWNCTGGHHNVGTVETCAECNVAKPKMENPKVTCPTCSSVTIVPSTNFSKDFREAGHNAKTLAVATAATVKASVEHLRAAPTTFHCAHCNSLLATPTGPWACQTCTNENIETDPKCKTCGQSKNDQKAICGVCRQSTVIPSSNLMDGLKNTAHGMVQGSKKVFFDVSGKPYVTCGRCNAHVKTGAPADAAHAAAAGSSAGAAASGTPVSADPSQVPLPSVEHAPDAPGAPAPEQLNAVEGSVNSAGRLVCPSCKNEMDL